MLLAHNERAAGVPRSPCSHMQPAQSADQGPQLMQLSDALKSDSLGFRHLLIVKIHII